MNHVIIVGRLTATPELLGVDTDNMRATITIAVKRTYKNQSGIYETDFIRCLLWNGIAKRASEMYKKGDILCVHGRLQVQVYESENQERKYYTEVIAEQVSLVSSYKGNEVSCQGQN